MSRWVRIAVSLFDSDHFPEEPFTEREAWIWIIAHAAWRETSHRIGNAVVPVPVGSFFTTVRNLRDEWKWGSVTKVQTFLKLLQRQDMISVETNTGKSQITVVNYKKYQDVNGADAALKGQGKVKDNTRRGQEKVTKDTITPEHHCTSKETTSVVPPRNRASGSRLPDDWVPSEEEISFAMSEGHDLASASREADKFKNYWIAKTGKDATKMDWTATWKNWIWRSSNQGRTPPITAPRLTEFQRRREENLAFFSGKVGPGNGAGTDDFGTSIDLGREDYGTA
jgi:hypothetical protein